MFSATKIGALSGDDAEVRSANAGREEALGSTTGPSLAR